MAGISRNNKATTMKSVLIQLQLQQYLSSFQKHNIDFSTFLTLNEQTLKTIGVKNESHRKILILWIKKLQILLNNNNNVTVNASDVSQSTTDTKKILSEIDGEEEDNNGKEDGNDDDDVIDDVDGDGEIIINEQLLLETVRNINRLLTPISEEEGSGSSFFLNGTNTHGNDVVVEDEDKGDGDGDDGIGYNNNNNTTATSIIIDHDIVEPAPEYSENPEIDLRHDDENHDNNIDDINEIVVSGNNHNGIAHYCYHNPQSTSTISTSASASSTASTLSSTIPYIKSIKPFKRFSSPLGIFNGSITRGDYSTNNNNNNGNGNNNNNNNNNTDHNKNIKRRKRKSILNPKEWRHSMPTISSVSSFSQLSRSASLSLPSSPPSYADTIADNYDEKNHRSYNANEESKIDYNDGEEDVQLPEYLCSVKNSGCVTIKKECIGKGSRAKIRSWKRRYVCLWGTLLRIYKIDPEVNVNALPTREFSMQDAQIGLAIDYPKRKNVLRIRFKTGHQYLIQAEDKEECILWIEKLQSSSNISSTIDERQMPMFITLPTRRRNNNGSSGGGDYNAYVDHNNELLHCFNNVSSLLSSSVLTTTPLNNLTYQQFNEIARELQQVQITNTLINQQLSW